MRHPGYDPPVNDSPHIIALLVSATFSASADDNNSFNYRNLLLRRECNDGMFDDESIFPGFLRLT